MLYDDNDVIRTFPQEIKDLVRDLGSASLATRQKAAETMAVAVNEPIRRAIFHCDTTSNIFVPTEYDRMCPIRYQLDLIQPGREKEYQAFAIPRCSSIPCKILESDAITIPTYRIGDCYKWCDDHARDSHYDMFARIVQILRAGFVKKINDDAWRLLIAGALDRNMIVFDDQALPGQFTKRLLSLMKLSMKRNNGGNGGTCENPCKLTDLYVSCEALEDMMNWGIDQISDDVRTRIFNTCDGLTEIFCVRLHDMMELGINQEYQLMYEEELNGVLPGASPDDGSGLHPDDPDNPDGVNRAKREIVVGLCLNNRENSFVMPVREALRTSAGTCDMEGYSYIKATQEFGLALLDLRSVILGAF